MHFYHYYRSVLLLHSVEVFANTIPVFTFAFVSFRAINSHAGLSFAFYCWIFLLRFSRDISVRVTMSRSTKSRIPLQ